MNPLHLLCLGMIALLGAAAIPTHAQTPYAGPDGKRWAPPVPAEIPAPNFSDHFGSHGVGHAEHHDIYKLWHPPRNPNTSCCSNADCRPTRAFVDPDGQWHAWNGNAWLSVPRDRVLPTDYARDGRTHLCEKEGFIYCFTPADPKI